MKKRSSDPVTIQHQFDTFVKRVLAGGVKTYRAEMARRAAREDLFCEMAELELNRLCATDKYSCDSESFPVLDYLIEIEDSEIADALKQLTETKRDVILLSYFLDMKDVEIAEALNLKGSTIHYHKDSSLRQLRKLLEGKGYEPK